MFGLMMLLFIVLSGFSFLESRKQVTPDLISHRTYQATDGKRVFQAYNCMGCHTIVGNGAYLAPDLTTVYKDTGPAWLAAFIPSAGQWPTEAAVRTQLNNADMAREAGAATLEEYYKKYPGAEDRIVRRGGKTTYMPNLLFGSEESGQLIAYLKYTSAMNTEGWPPRIMTGSLQRRLELLHGPPVVPAVASASGARTVETSATPAEHGAQLVQTYGCLACHSTDSSKRVGPGWAGLYDSVVRFDDGTSTKCDDDYLIEAILKPHARTVAGYPKGTMPSYEGVIKENEAKDIVAYIRTLEKK